MHFYFHVKWLINYLIKIECLIVELIFVCTFIIFFIGEIALDGSYPYSVFYLFKKSKHPRIQSEI